MLCYMFTKHSTVSIIIALNACARKLIFCVAIKINLKSSADKIVVSWSYSCLLLCMSVCVCFNLISAGWKLG